MRAISILSQQHRRLLGGEGDVAKTFGRLAESLGEIPRIMFAATDPGGLIYRRSAMLIKLSIAVVDFWRTWTRSPGRRP